MKIVNRKKFIKSVIILIVGLIVILMYFTNASFSKVEVQTKIVTVVYGDTLWTIAESEQENNKYYEDKKIQEIVYDIKNINNLKDSYLYEGQKLEIPCYK